MISAQYRSYQSVNWQSPINFLNPLNMGLIAWWLVVPHWKGGTVFRDLANGRNNGTLTNMDPINDWVTQTDRLGGWGALDFDGSDDLVNVPDNSSFGFEKSEGFSVGVWLNFDVAGGAETIVSKIGAGAGDSGWSFGKTFSAGQPVLNFLLQDGGRINVEVTNTSFLINEWSYFVFTYDGSEVAAGVTHYKNGFPTGLDISQDDLSSSILNALDLQIGARAAATFFNGTMDDLRIYNRELSAKEVAEYYRLSRNYYSGLFNYWSPVPVQGFAAPVTDILDLERGTNRGILRGVMEGV